jgi:hypothetical protein
MTGGEARAALRAFVAVGNLELWIAEQPWEEAPGGGWTVPQDLRGWRFRVLPVADGVRVTRTGEGAPATWFVPAAFSALLDRWMDERRLPDHMRAVPKAGE